MNYKYQSTKNSYNQKTNHPTELSRSKIDLFLNCPRCFYLEKKLGVKQPPGFPFTLNTAVDGLLKKEFDIHRAQGVAHPLMKAYKIKAVPYPHSDLDKWRENFHGMRFLHKPTNILVFGAIDDVWENEDKSLSIVDYKSTAKAGEVNLDADWQIAYKRQIEIYQWLFRQNGFKVSKTGYFVYCNGKKDAKAFDAKLEFDIVVIPYTGDDSWVNGTLRQIKKTLNSNSLPQPSGSCDYCEYRRKVKLALER